jgi:DNA polymerase-3 subunit alpha
MSLGIYLTVHPLDKFHYKPFYDINDNEQAIIAGEVLDISEIKDKNANKMAFVTLGNQYGNVKCVVFSSAWGGAIKSTFMENQFVAVVGRKSGTSLLIDKVKPLKV